MYSKVHINKRLKNFSSKSFFVLFLILFFFSNFNQVLALDWPYAPGATLDPGCAPGDTDCVVEITTGSSPWSTLGSNTYYNTGNVGIGIDSPTALLDVKLNPTYNYNQTDNATLIAQFSGIYTGSRNNQIIVQIDSLNNPDTFSYTVYNNEFGYEDCPPNSNIPITGSPQYLCLGISITFDNTTGHTSGDNWTYIIEENNPTQKLFSIRDDSYDYINITKNNSFIGYRAGSGVNTNNLIGVNFLGNLSGYQATNTEYSTFLGFGSGYQSTNADNSNFIGSLAGIMATNARNSTFIGTSAGSYAINAKNSTFIGNNAGIGDMVDNSSNDYSILIGDSSSTGGYSNSIALGTYASNTATNQFMIGSNFKPINTTVWKGAGSVTCTFTTSSGSIACSSDKNLKKNIFDLDNTIFNLRDDINVSDQTTLDKLLSITPVTYNWNYEADTDQVHMGFIAQEVEQIFPSLVYTDENTELKSLNTTGLTPYIIKAIQEMDIKLSSINDMEKENSWRESLIAWFGDVSNGIMKFVVGTLQAKDKVCIGNTCINEEQLLEILNKENNTSTFVETETVTETEIQTSTEDEEGDVIDNEVNGANNETGIEGPVTDTDNVVSQESEEVLPEIDQETPKEEVTIPEEIDQNPENEVNIDTELEINEVTNGSTEETPQ